MAGAKFGDLAHDVDVVAVVVVVVVGGVGGGGGGGGGGLLAVFWDGPIVVNPRKVRMLMKIEVQHVGYVQRNFRPVQ